MKTKFSSAALLVATALFLSNVVRADITTGLVLKLDLNELSGTNAMDSSGLGNNATLVNFPVDDSGWTTGWKEGGLKFNNPLVPTKTNYLIIPNAPSLNFNTDLHFTLATWVKLPAAQIAGAGIIGKGAGGNENYALDVTASKFRIVTRFSPTVPVTLSSASVVSSNWTHVAAVWDGVAKTMRLYVNGQINAATTNNNLAAILATSTPVTIGARQGNAVAGNYNLTITNAMMDDVRIFNRSLTDADIFEMYSEFGRVPSISTQPRNVVAYVGDSPIFNVGINAGNSTLPVYYQWRLEGTNIVGATNSSLIVTNAQSSNAGTYTVAISNVIGTTLSQPATLQLQALPPADYTNQLVGYWTFDDASGSSSAVDSSGNGNAGTLAGFSDFSQCWTTGILSGALRFNATTSLADVVAIPAVATPAPAILDFSANPVFTLAAWVKGTPTQTSGAGVICKGNGGGGEQFTLDIFAGFYRFYVRNASGSIATVNTAVGPNNVWQHLTATFNAANSVLSVYVNGQLAGTAVAPDSLLANTHEVSIGNRQSASAAYNLPFSGIVDDVRIYSRQLTSADIGSLYLAGGVFGPEFTVHPENLTRYVGDDARFTTVFSGTAPITLQWQKDGTNLLGATNAALVFTNLQLSNAGSYRLYASNAYGAAISSNATLEVTQFNFTNLLAGYWKFDDGSGTTAADSSTSANTGSLNGFPVDSRWLAGRFGGSLDFNANGQNNNVVLIPDAANLNFDTAPAFSIVAWVRASVAQVNGGAIVAKGFGAGGEQYAVDFQNGAYRFHVRNSAGVSTALQSAVTPSGTWQQIVCTLDGSLSVMKIYVNGQLAASGTAPSSLFANNHEVSIGNRQSNTSAYNLPFVGMIDDVRIYTRPLNASEIQQLYSAAGSFGPVIYSFKPANVTALCGDNVTFVASADGDAPLSFQWLKDGTNIFGATNLTYALQNVQFADAGTYTLTVSNLTSGISSNAVLQVQAVPAPNLTSNLVAHWPFDETSGNTSTDVSGNGNQLSLFNFPGDNSQWEAGRIGNALFLNKGGESNQFAGTDMPLTLQNGNLFSFSFWAKVGVGARGVNPRLISPLGGQHWVLWTPNRGVGFYVPTNSSEPSIASWNHFVVTYNRPAGTYSLFVNGAREVVDAGPYVRNDPTDPILPGNWVIGHSEITDPTKPASTTDSWNGLLDDMRVYNRLLTINDARALYFAAAGQPPLAVMKNGNFVTLSWSSAATGFQLQQSAALGTDASWGTVPGTPVSSADGLTQSVTVPIESDAKFYRLLK